MSIAHGAQYASATLPPLLEDATTRADGERFEPTGEGFAGFETIGERLAVLAVAARIMVRRHPGDVYARSIARETVRLAGAMREALHAEASPVADAPASGIVETTLATPATPASAPPAPPEIPHTPATPDTHHRGRGSARASSRSKQSPRAKTPARKGGAV